MKQTAQVLQIDENGYAKVKVRRASACASAHNCGSCDHCSMMENAPELIVRAANTCGAKIGDTVTVESATSKVLGAAALLYLTPIVLFFIGYFVGQALAFAESGSIAIGGVGFIIGLLASFILDHYRRSKPVTYQITAVE